MEMPSYELIIAAVDGDNEAIEKIIQHYTPMIEEMSGGNEDMRQEIILTLIDAINHYDLENEEKNMEYLRRTFPDQYE